MSEREIRDAIRQLCRKLDVKARAEARRRGSKLVYPLIVGAGLLVANCDDDPEVTTDYGAAVIGARLHSSRLATSRAASCMVQATARPSWAFLPVVVAVASGPVRALLRGRYLPT